MKNAPKNTCSTPALKEEDFIGCSATKTLQDFIKDKDYTARTKKIWKKQFAKTGTYFLVIKVKNHGATVSILLNSGKNPEEQFSVCEDMRESLRKNYKI